MTRVEWSKSLAGVSGEAPSSHASGTFEEAIWVALRIRNGLSRVAQYRRCLLACIAALCRKF
jgi:hypothetical protein